MAFRSERNTESIRILRAVITQKNTTAAEVNILSFIKSSDGDSSFKKIMNMVEKEAATVATTMSPVLILSLFESERGRNLTKAASNPTSDSMAIIFITEISVVANPMLVVENIRATMSQKTKPKPAITTVASIR